MRGIGEGMGPTMKHAALTLALVTTGIAPHALSVHATTHGMAITVDSGYIVNADGSVGGFVGTYTSGLQQLIDGSYPAISSSDLSSISIFNATELRYLTLKGDAGTDGHSYLSDVTLQLPSMFVLTLEGSMGVAPNATLKSDVTPPMVALDGVSYSAVLGGTYDATGNTTYEAIRIKDGSHCKLEGVTGYGSGTNIIEVVNEAQASPTTTTINITSRRHAATPPPHRRATVAPAPGRHRTTASQTRLAMSITVTPPLPPQDPQR